MTWNKIVWSQFGAALDMLENAIRDCPDDLWQARLYQDPTLPEFAEFWNIASHVIFWLDFYLGEGEATFKPPEPFTLSELDPAGKMPDRVYTKDELLTYLAYGRNKCKTKLESMGDEMLTTTKTPWRDMSVAEMMLYNLRHVQEHGAQLSLFLGQKIGWRSTWVGKAKNKDLDA